MIHSAYTAALRIGLLAALPYYAVRSPGRLSTLGERLGWIEEGPLGPAVWVHAVSVGEVRSIDRLLAGLRAELPAHRIVVSTTTPTGRSLVEGRPDLDRVVYFPLDLPGAVGRSLDRIQPDAVIVVETEIWPNFLREAGRRRIPVFMVNGRISDRSFPRYRRARRWLGPVLDRYRLLGMQSELDAERIRAMGAPPEKVAVLGNLKYDLPAEGPPLEPALASRLAAWTPLLVAASTAAGEEPLVLEAYRALRRRRPLKLLIAPRRQDRFDEVETILARSGLPFVRRSRLEDADGDPDVMLLDTIGELNAVFPFGTVVFMGGTLTPRGGHNILEPARYRKPIVFGPHMENFRDMARTFLEGRAAVQVGSVDELGRQLAALLEAPAEAAAMGERSRALVDRNAGATRRVLDALLPVLEETSRSGRNAASWGKTG